MSDDKVESSWSRRLELLSVLLIALTAVLTAWSAFQSSKWSGVMSIRFNEAGASRTESVRNSNEANAQVGLDVNLFANYVAAVAEDDTGLAEFVQERFPERLGRAVDAWLETRPLETPDAPASPFEMDEYQVEARDEAATLEARADHRARQARDANQTSDNYTVTSVFFATAILLAALSSKVSRSSLQFGMLAGATVLLVGTGLAVATFPIEI